MKLIAPNASPEEAAAIVAALERFMRATASPPPTDAAATLDAWHEAASLEAVSRDPWETIADSALGGHWINP
ncbi:MAG TPA: hypothetical protein VMD79_15400 [Solirubrobacteraceae bacterium]|nr:hypothetical protein [Solirubrobacteraceae bacterium]